MERYEIDNISGKIDQSGIFLAHEKPTGRKVAIKLFSNLTDLQRERLLKDAKRLQNLIHPHIVPLLDFGTDQDQDVYYVMEYLEGKSLLSMVPQGQGLSFEEAWPIIEKLASALSVIHQAGLLHLDLKPGNILMVSGEPVIIDFGLLIPSDPELFRGTPGYIAPEVITGKTPSIQSDIYSFGALTAYMLTGYKLTSGDSPESILAHQLSDGQVVMQNQELARVVARATKKDPARRYANITEMLKPLQLYAHEQDHLALEPSEQLIQTESGHWVIGGVITSLIIIACGIYYFLLNSI